MLLKDEIKKLQEEMFPVMPEEVVNLLIQKISELVESGIAEKALKEGDSIPQVTLSNAVGNEINVNSLLKEGPLVISFYRGAWCPYCNLELHSLQQVLPELKALGAQLVAISPNTPDNSRTSIEKHKIEFEVLSDFNNKVAKEFGLVFSLAEEVRPIHLHLGFDIPKYNGNNSWDLPVPATYIVNTDGTIAHAFVNADYTQRMEPTDIIIKLKDIVSKKQMSTD